MFIHFSYILLYHFLWNEINKSPAEFETKECGTKTSSNIKADEILQR